MNTPRFRRWMTDAARLVMLVAWLPVRALAQTPVQASAQTPAQTRAHAVVDASYVGRDGARVSGVPTWRTLGMALRAAPSHARSPWVIRVRDGRYHEKLSVDKPNIRIIGDSRERTVITYDAFADTPAPGGGTLGTRGSWTLKVTAPDFRLEHITIENAYDYARNAAKADSDKTKSVNTQGVALATTDSSDRASFEDVRLLGHQDTFFANAGRQYFHHCEIAGHVDFIFGAGQAVFDDCDIISLDRGRTTDNGYVVAPSTDVSHGFGFLFIHSRLRKEHPTMTAGSVALGRPWHPSASSTTVGSAVFVDCWMDDHISAKGWERMSSIDPATGTRIWFEPTSARFFEYRSTGPGATASPTRRVLNDGDARTYTMSAVLDGWVPPHTPKQL